MGDEYRCIDGNLDPRRPQEPLPRSSGTGRVPQNGRDDNVPDCPREVLVARLLQGEQEGTRDFLRQSERIAGGKQGILGAMNHERWNVHLCESLPPTIACVKDKGVRHARRDVRGAIENAPGEVTHGCFVERARTTCKRALSIDHVVDHAARSDQSGSTASPVKKARSSSDIAGRSGFSCPGPPGVAKAKVSDCDPIGMVECHELADRRALRHAYEMGAGEAEGVEQGCGIHDQIAKRVRRGTGL
jgi:hypothetical protein